jgi:hypothetical protein
MKIIVPMAGLGSRFIKAAETNPEYKKPKPFILVKGIPMVRWATGSLPFIEHPGQIVHSPIRVTPADLIFVILKEHDDTHGLEQGLRQIYGNAIRVIILHALTRGASETAWHAKPYISPNEAVIISDSDHYFDGKPFETSIFAALDSDVAGVIPVFVPPADNVPRWSYSLTEKGGTRIIDEGEKDRTLMERGAYANIGAYYFAHSKTFFDTFERVERQNKLTGEEGKKEFYVAPLYKELLDEGKHIEAAVLPEVWGLGTPSDLEHFLANCPEKKPY